MSRRARAILRHGRTSENLAWRQSPGVPRSVRVPTGKQRVSGRLDAFYREAFAEATRLVQM
ncbi:hypothetical protein A33M_0907 [Rhodovulum sp. PH10]|nr:hypothetical protein A33M_0907 [Rhodovulum sp. PH10]